MAYFPRDLRSSFDEETLTFTFQRPGDHPSVNPIFDDALGFHSDVITWLFDIFDHRVIIVGPSRFENELESYHQSPGCVIGEFVEDTGAWLLQRKNSQPITESKLKIRFNKAEYAMMFKLTWC